MLQKNVLNKIGRMREKVKYSFPLSFIGFGKIETSEFERVIFLLYACVSELL
jgi:hypothetical protein